MPSQEERNTNLDKLESLKKELEALQTELAKYGACDPAKVEEKKRALMLAKEAAIRWTGKLGFYGCFYGTQKPPRQLFCGAVVLYEAVLGRSR
jgi:hypothetical protein